MREVLIVYLGSRGGGVLDTYEICKALCEVGGNNYSAIISQNNPLKEKYFSLPLKALSVLKTHKLSLRDFVFQTIIFNRILKIIRTIAKIKPSIILFTMEHPWVLPILIYLKMFMPKAKVVYIKHNPRGFESVSSRVRNAVADRIDRIMTNKADYIFTLSQYVKDAIIETFKLPPEKVYSFRFGVHHSFCEGFVHRGFLRDGILRLLFFGRILRYKGIDTLVEAFEIMKNKNLPVQLTIAGGGNIEAQILNKIKKLGISLLNCWIDDSELRLLLSEADVVIIPYKQASQSGPASIAVALGIPVIATRVGGLTEQVYDGVNGILIKPNSPEEIVKAVEQILAQPETLNRFSEGAKSLRENELSWNNTAKEMAKHFRKF